MKPEHGRIPDQRSVESIPQRSHNPYSSIDINDNGIVDMYDAIILSSYFGQSIP